MNCEIISQSTSFTQKHSTVSIISMEYENLTKPWTFTAQELDVMRNRANCEARLFIKNNKSKKENIGAGGSAPSAGNAAATPQLVAKSFAKNFKLLETEDANMPASENDKFLTPQEEITLINFYSTKLLPLIGPNANISKLKRDIKVASTAAILLRRFFLSNSVTLFDPKTIMVASAFLASKVEDALFDVRYLEDGTKSMSAHVKIHDIIEAEVALVKGIDFDLVCFHPYKVVLAYTVDLRAFLKSKDGKKCANRDFVSGEDLRPIYNGARDIVESIIFQSDVMLLASPGKVGFAAMMLSNERWVKENVEKDREPGAPPPVQINFKGYLESRFGDEKKEHEINVLWDEMVALLNMLRSAAKKSEPDMIVLKGIHKKLKKCRIWGKDGKKKKRKHAEVDKE